MLSHLLLFFFLAGTNVFFFQTRMSNAKQKLNAFVNNKLKQSRFKIINADAFKLIVSHVASAANAEEAIQQMIEYLHQDSST